MVQETAIQFCHFSKLKDHKVKTIYFQNFCPAQFQNEVF